MKKTRNYLNRNFNKEREDDKLTKNDRSSLMSKIRSKNTKFEQEFISALKEGTKSQFKTNVSTIKGKPDIVFQREKIVVFLDIDFWHGWQYPRWKHLLKNDFWRDKIENNRSRDKKTTIFLRKNSWKVIRFWEHDIKKNIGETIDKIIDYLENKTGIITQVDPRKCAKRHVVAIIEKDEKYYVGSDWCHNPQKKCPRLPGEDYSKCKTVCKQDGHAEIEAIKAAKGRARGGVMYLIGHDHCCEPCLVAMGKAGIKKIIFNVYPKNYQRHGIKK